MRKKKDFDKLFHIHPFENKSRLLFKIFKKGYIIFQSKLFIYFTSLLKNHVFVNLY